MISLFYEDYGEEENELSKYEIVKRKVFSNHDLFDEDYIASCTLNNKREICVIDVNGINSYSNVCDGCSSEACNRLCINNVDINFPRFAWDKDIVMYLDYDGKKRYGVYLENMSGIKEEYYIIPLDCMAMKYRIFERDFYSHEHIEAPFIERIEWSDIPEDIKNIYQEYLEFLKKRNCV